MVHVKSIPYSPWPFSLGSGNFVYKWFDYQAVDFVCKSEWLSLRPEATCHMLLPSPRCPAREITAALARSPPGDIMRKRWKMGRVTVGSPPCPLRISCWVASTSLPQVPFGKMVGHLLLQTGVEIPPKAYRDPSPSQSFFPLPKLVDPSQVPRLRNCWEPPFPICNIELEG